MLYRAVPRVRFGLLGMRVFNTLGHHGQLEPKQIADFIKREHKEARELLYRMFKAGYLQMQVRPCCVIHQCAHTNNSAAYRMLTQCSPKHSGHLGL